MEQAWVEVRAMAGPGVMACSPIAPLVRPPALAASSTPSTLTRRARKEGARARQWLAIVGSAAAIALPLLPRRRQLLRGNSRVNLNGFHHARSSATAASSRTARQRVARRAQFSDKEIELLLDAAEKGDAESQCYAAEVALDESRGGRDPEKAAEWLRKAADQGMVAAQYNLGMMLTTGDGVPQDPVAGASWLEKAALQGQGLSQYYYGMMLLQGDGIPEDKDKGMYFLGSAAENEVVDAQYTLGCMLLDTPEQAVTEKQWAAHWLNKAAEQKDPRAMYQIARMFKFGIGMEQDDAKAANWVSGAASTGLQDAQYLMGTMLLAGEGVEENREWAAHWFEQAALQGHVDAQYNLGLMLESGDGIPEDKAKAQYWLEKAAAQGDEEAAKTNQQVTDKMESEEN